MSGREQDRPRPPVVPCPGCADVPACGRPADPTTGQCARCAGPAAVRLRSRGRTAGNAHGERQAATDAQIAAWAAVKQPDTAHPLVRAWADAVGLPRE